jgi:hypothetical protein
MEAMDSKVVVRDPVYSDLKKILSQFRGGF